MEEERMPKISDYLLKETTELEKKMTKTYKTSPKPYNKPYNPIRNKELNQSKTREDIEVKYGIGLDVGTGFLVGGSYKNGNIIFKSIRDAFIGIEKEKFNPHLFSEDVKYIEFDDSVFIVGENAIEFATAMNKSALRPLANGIVNPKERQYATAILQELFSYVIKSNIKKENEKLFFSIPGKHISDNDFDTTFHTMSIQSLCNSFGVDASPLNEAYAVGISELGTSRNLTALCFSFGAGLVNACLAYKGINLFEFCMDKSGDFIDRTVAQGCGEETAYICKIKENELNLNKNEYASGISDIEKHLILIYRVVIKNTINEVIKAFKSSKDVKIREELPIVISGGTSLPKGFIGLFEENLKASNLPFKVTEIIHASDPLKAVAKGCCMWSNTYEK